MAMSCLIIGCGGFGTNRVVDLINADIKRDLPDIDFMIVDGSDSNIKDVESAIDLENIFWRVDGIDGAGKKRGKGAQKYIQYIAENFSRIPQADVYVLAYSLTGGSGSVIGPELNRRLMADGRNTINVVLATSDSKEDVKNTFNTLNGLANNVTSLQRPIHFMIEESDDSTRSEVDADVNANIIHAASICGIHHHGLDSNDVASFLDYQQHDVKPALTMIERYDEPEALMEMSGKVITILSLLTDNDNLVPKVGAVFNTDALHKADRDVHFITTTVYMEKLYNKVKEEHENYMKIAGGLNVKNSFGQVEGAHDETGMVY